MPLSETDWAILYEGIRAKTGLDLWQYKPEPIRSRILAIAAPHGGILDYWNSISSADLLVQGFLDEIAINVSELFRDPDRWDVLKSEILPVLTSARRNLACWSAGCSFGAEATTLAVLLQAHFPGHHRVLGTDIDRAAIVRAKRGEFRESEMREVPEHYRAAYFDGTGGLYKASPEIRAMLEFERGNLLGDEFRADFDLIICRNVAIYFTESAKRALFARLAQALAPGGVMFLGTSERLSCEDFGLSLESRGFYRRYALPKAA